MGGYSQHSTLICSVVTVRSTKTATSPPRQALSFSKLIEVSRAGLPVDMASLPVPPQMQVVARLTSLASRLLTGKPNSLKCGLYTGHRKPYTILRFCWTKNVRTI